MTLRTAEIDRPRASAFQGAREQARSPWRSRSYTGQHHAVMADMQFAPGPARSFFRSPASVATAEEIFQKPRTGRATAVFLAGIAARDRFAAGADLYEVDEKKPVSHTCDSRSHIAERTFRHCTEAGTIPPSWADLFNRC